MMGAAELAQQLVHSEKEAAEQLARGGKEAVRMVGDASNEAARMVGGEVEDLKHVVHEVSQRLSWVFTVEVLRCGVQ
jgi:cell division septum initiation protein DivIVA